MANSPAMILCRGHNNPFLKCKGSPQNEKEFYSSRSPLAYYPVEVKNATSGKIHYCKTCVQKIFEYELEKSRDIRKATYYTCQRLDIPFMVELFNNAILESKGKTIVDATKVNQRLMGEYIRMLNLNKSKYGKNIDFSCSDTTLSGIDTSIDEIKRTKRELDRFHLDWGTEHKEEEYAFLEYRYSVYTDGKEISPAQETLYRQLCLVELSKRRKETTRELTKDEQAMILTLMEKLKISNFNEQKDKSDIDKILERQIWEIENTEPCELVDKKEYEDFLDIGKNWGKHIIRAVKNLVANTKDYPDVTKDEWD